ncbi:uncharacterized protein LOC117179305 isoform X2 [Belonocnema kinseyi]|uniref:uncharacterized protein LOC117179305 isoform X2 n=1 Tax=Belonocnema kinseyi TaxID=2817044 RepID=UPI00143CFCA8|nr:uncharacterized protein LOC117179305 isoform X2 [Belonocnema kinseyi]
MPTPVLTQEQQRKTLSAKKGPVKGLRNVLAQPYDIYCLMLPLKQPKSFILWSQLRKVKKKERISVKKTSHENDKISSLNKSFVTGVNAVTRGLERRDLCFVLLDSNTEPILVKHIVTMTENENIPVVLIPFLKIVTLETLGFESVAFALKNDVKNSMDHHFHALYNKISELSASFIRPNLLVQSFPKKVSKDETIESNPVAILNRQNFKIHTFTTYTLSSNFYLYRLSTRERIFVPKGSNSTIISSPPSKDWNDFIPLVEDPSLKSSRDVILGKKIEKIRAKAERYMDFCNQIGDLNEKISVTNGNGEIFGFLDASYSEVIIKNNNTNDILERAELSNNEKNIKECATTVFSYIPLKVKRMQGNSSRIKCTKAPKSKKK